MSMARLHLCVCAALFYFLAFSSPLVAGRLGGRSCHTSFFFIKDHNDLRLLPDTDGSEHGAASADLKILPSTGSGHVWIEGHGLPLSLIQVRLLNLQKLSLFDPGFFPHGLDLSDAWRDTLAMEKLPHGEQPARGKFLSAWSFSTSDPHQPVVWINVRSRRGLWHREFPDLAEQKPLHLDEDGWQSTVKELWQMVCAAFLGAGSVMVTLGFVTLVSSLIRRVCAHAQAQDDEEDVGFLYGYQELVAPEKEGSKGDEKESAKEGAIVAQNTQA